MHHLGWFIENQKSTVLNVCTQFVYLKEKIIVINKICQTLRNRRIHSPKFRNNCRYQNLQIPTIYRPF